MNWERDHAVSFLGIHKSDFPYSVSISYMGYPKEVRQTVFLVIWYNLHHWRDPHKSSKNDNQMICGASASILHDDPDSRNKKL
jgi:hypothetical protein